MYFQVRFSILKRTRHFYQFNANIRDTLFSDANIREAMCDVADVTGKIDEHQTETEEKARDGN